MEILEGCCLHTTPARLPSTCVRLLLQQHPVACALTDQRSMYLSAAGVTVTVTTYM